MRVGHGLECCKGLGADDEQRALRIGLLEQIGLFLEQAGERPVIFRTLDAGGDKLLPYMPESADENPAMGWRAIRIALDRPVLLRQQLRALIAASAGLRLRVMFPMIAEIAELDAARSILELELERAWRRDCGQPPADGALAQIAVAERASLRSRSPRIVRPNDPGSTSSKTSSAARRRRTR